MLHVLYRHDEWNWHWRKAPTLYNEENDKLAMRATNYIFSCRNRNWDSPNLMQFWFLFFLSFFFLLLFFCLFFFLIIQSQAANCKLPIRSEIYNCTLKNTKKVSIIIIYRVLCNLYYFSFIFDIVIIIIIIVNNKKIIIIKYHYHYYSYYYFSRFLVREFSV